MGEKLVGLLLSWAIFYMPLLTVLVLVVGAAVAPRLRPICGTSALWGLAAGAGVFASCWTWAFTCARESNIAPVIGIFAAPVGFAVGAWLGVGYGVVRARTRSPDA